MCDYSLYQFPNRLCADQEELITYRFSSGCIGLVSTSEAPSHCAIDSTWCQSQGPSLRSWLLPRMGRIGPVAVCLPPGTRLIVGGKGEAILIHRGLEAFRYRDALQFDDGREILLQELPPGTRIRINPAVSEAERIPELQSRSSYESA